MLAFCPAELTGTDPSSEILVSEGLDCRPEIAPARDEASVMAGSIWRLVSDWIGSAFVVDDDAAFLVLAEAFGGADLGGTGSPAELSNAGIAALWETDFLAGVGAGDSLTFLGLFLLVVGSSAGVADCSLSAEAEPVSVGVSWAEDSARSRSDPGRRRSKGFGRGPRRALASSLSMLEAPFRVDFGRGTSD